MVGPRALDPAAHRPRRLRPRVSAAVLSFIVAFGLAKALTNLAAGVARASGRPPAAADPRLGDRAARAAADRASRPSWDWIVAANVLLGVNQGLAWSMTVVMKIDLVGPEAARASRSG